MTKMLINGKMTGDLIGSTLVKKGRQVVLMRAMDGFGLPTHVVLNPRVKNIRLHYGGYTYKTTADVYLRHGIPYHRQGYEPQIILSRNRFEIINEGQGELF